jgi:hypothetical protein
MSVKSRIHIGCMQNRCDEKSLRKNFLM